MVAIVGGTGLGLFNSSLSQLNGYGSNGRSQVGQGRDQAYVNASTGNLVIQGQDDYLVSLGLDLAMMRTYNSQGLLDGANNDGWTHWGSQRLLTPLPVAGATGNIVRVNADGHQATFTHIGTDLWRSTDGAGAHDTLQRVGSTWVYTEGSSRITETYDANGRLSNAKDQDGNTQTYGYTGSQLTSITDTSGQVTTLAYDGAGNLLSIKTAIGNQEAIRVRYTYDGYNRLKTVEFDVGNADDTVRDADTQIFFTQYEYESTTSNRVTQIQQGRKATVGGGLIETARLNVGYVASGTYAGRVQTVSQVVDGSSSRSLTFSYLSATQTSITDGLGKVTTYTYDSQQRLTTVEEPTVDGTRSTTHYVYDADGNVSRVSIRYGSGATDFRITDYTYSNGNLTKIVDALGNTVERSYNANNQLLTETVYRNFDPVASDPVTTRYVYDGESHLRYEITAEGRVTEHRYNPNGTRLQTRVYTADTYTAALFAEGDLNTWVGALADKTQQQLTAYVYDFRGALSVVVHYPSVNPTTLGGAGEYQRTFFVYGRSGELLETVEQNTSFTDFTGTGSALNGQSTGYWDYLGEQWRATNKNEATVSQKYVTGGSALSLDAATTRVFRGEFTSGPTHAGREIAFGISNNLLDSDAEYWRHLVLFEGNQIKALTTAGATTTATVLGTAKDNVTYVIEIVRTLTESRLYVYERGKSREAAGSFSHTLSAIPSGTLTGWNQVKWHGYTVSGPGKTGTVGYFDNFSLHFRQIQAPTSQANLTTYLYDGLGRMISTTDGAGRMTVTDYQDANLKVVTTAQNGLTNTATYNKAGDVVQAVQSGASIVTATTAYAYDANGRLRMVTDATGGRTHYLYDERGWKVGEIGPDNQLAEYGYNQAGQLLTTKRYATAVTATLVSGGVPATITLVSVRPATHAEDRTVLTHYYDAAGRLKYVVDAGGYVTETVYDGASRVTATIGYNSVLPGTANTLNLIYNNRNLQANRDDVQNRVTRNFYDKDGLLIGTLDAEGYLTEREYDKARQLVRQVAYALPLGVTGVTDVRNFNTLLTAAQAAVTDIAAKNQTSRMLYDGIGRLWGSIDPAGYYTHYIYDRGGNRIEERRYSQPVVYAATKDATAYRLEARAAALSAPVGDVIAFYRRMIYTYDALNRVQDADEYYYVMDPAGTESNGRVAKTTYSYDAQSGLLVRTTAGAELTTGSAQRRSTTVEYDTAGRVKRELSGIGSHALISLPTTATEAQRETIWTQYATVYEYDAAGRRISSQDANGLKTVYYYDTFGRLRYSVNAAGEVIETTYTAFGEIDTTKQYAQRIATTSLTGGLDSNATLTGRLTAALRNDVNNRITDLDYDVRGLLKKKTDPLAFAIEQTYNAFGQLKDRNSDVGATPGSSKRLDTFSYDRRGLQIASLLDSATGGLQIGETLAYDAFGRVTTRIDALGRQWKTEYDTLGRAVQTRDSLNQTSLTSYDAFSRTLSQTDKLGKVTTYAYDARGKTITVTTPEGIQTQSVYDRYGKLALLKIWNNGIWETTTYDYDRDGNLTRVTDPNTFYTESNYDNAGRVTETFDKNGIKTVFTYDAANRVMTRTVDPGSGTNSITGQAYLNLVTTYVYDAFGGAIRTTDPELVVTDLVFDKNGQVVKQIADTVQRSGQPAPLRIATVYTYDADGRRLTVSEGIQAVLNGNTWDTSATPLRTTQYSYDKAGRLTKEIVDPGSGTNPNTLSPYLNITTEYGYDRNNNLTWKKDANLNLWRYVYDELNRRTHEVAPDGGITESRFDGMGRVVASIRHSVLGVPPALWPEAEGITQPVSWSNDFSVHANDLTVSPSQTVLVRTAATQRLTLTTETMTTPTSAYAYGQREYNLATVGQVTFRGEILVEGTGGQYHLGMDQGTGGYKMHSAFFSGGRIYAYYNNGTTNGSVDLGASASGTTYVMEVVATASGSRLHIYTKGQSRQSGYVHDLATTWTAPRLRMQVNARTAGSTQRAYVDNLAEYLATPLNAADQVTRYVYDNDGRQVYQIDALGYVTKFIRDAGGRILEEVRYASPIDLGALPLMAIASSINPPITAALDRGTLYSYDAAGRLKDTTDAAGNKESYGYDKAGNRTSLTNKLLNVWSYGYDAIGRLVEERAPAENQIVDMSATIVAPNPVTLTKLSVHKTTLIGYDKVGNVISRREGYKTGPTSAFEEKRATVYVYDARGLQVRVKYDGVSAYNAAADLSGGLGAASPRVLTSINTQSWYDNTQAYHDAQGMAILGIDQNGTISYKVYDSVGRLQFDVDAERGVTGYTYDAFGNIRYAKRFEASVPEVAGGSLVTLEAALKGAALDTADRHTKALAAQVWVANHVRNMTGSARIVETTYDNLNRVQTVKEPEVSYFLAEGVGYRKLARPTTQYRYDAFGNIVEQSILRKADDLGVPLEWIVSYSQYDKNNRLIRQVDGGGYLTEIGYNAFGERTSKAEYAKKLQVSAPPTNWTVLAALASSVPATSVGYNPVEGYDRRQWFGYDKMGRLEQEQILGIQYSRINASNLPETVVGNLTVKQLQYDALGNLTHETDNAGATTFRKYDKLGRVVATILPPVTGDSGVSVLPLTAFGYDVLGNLIETIRYINGATAAGNVTPILLNAAADQKIYSRYDKLGRVIEVIDAAGKSEFYAYDASGLLAKKWRLQSLAVSGTATAGELYTYDRVGRQRETIVLKRQADKGGYGIGTRNNYNAYGEVIGQGVFEHEYRLSGSTYSDIVTGSYQKYFDYDSNGRLWQTNAENGINTAYEHDLQGNATAKIVTPGGPHFTSPVRLSSPANVGAAAGMRTETSYDRLGRVSAVKEPWFKEDSRAAGGAELVKFASRRVSATEFSSYRFSYGDFASEVASRHSVVLKWEDISSWGNGNVFISVEYLREDGSSGIGSSYPLIGSANAETGYTLEWDDYYSYSDEYGYHHPAVASITAVYVSKTDAPGVVARDLSATTELYELSLDPALGVGFTGLVEYRLASSAPNGAWLSTNLTKVSPNARAWRLALPAGTSGQYEYRIKLTDSVSPSLGLGRASLDPGSSIHEIFMGTFQVSNGTVLSASTSPTAPSQARTPIRTQEVDRWGNTISVTDPRDATIVTQYRYDHANHLVRTDFPGIKIWTAIGAIATPPFANFTQSYYDARGFLIAEKDAKGNVDKKTYDTAGKLISEIDAVGALITYRYDGLGREVRRSEATAEIIKTYDLLDRLKTQNVGGVSAVASGNIYTFANWETEYWYDELGNRISEANAADERTYYRYNTAGQVLDVLTPLAQANLSSAYRRTYAYDRYGNKVSDNDGVSAQTWAYDGFGHLIYQIDRAGVVSYYQYDSYGRLHVQINNPQNQVANKDGGIISTHGQYLTYSYYENGWLKEVSDTGANDSTGSKNFSQRFSYDLAGNRVREQYADQATGRIYQDNRIVYDELNRVTRVRDMRQVTEYGYDANGNRIRSYSRYLEGAILQGNGTQNTPTFWDAWYEYDAENRVTISQGIRNSYGQIDIRPKDANTPAQGIKLAYDLAGNRRQMVQYNDATLRTYEYSYDAEHRLIRSTWKEDVAAQTGLVYDSEGYPVYDQNGNYVYQTVSEAYTRQHHDDYRYDLAGRRIEEKRWYEDGRPNAGGVYTVFYSYQESRKEMRYNLNGWLTQQVQYKPNNTVQSTVYYSAATNPGSTTADYYDAAGNLLQYRLVAGSTSEYKYTYIKYGGGYKVSAIAVRNSYSQSGARERLNKSHASTTAAGDECTVTI